MRSFWPTERIAGWLIPVLAIVTEGALLAVIYIAVQTTIDHRAPLLGTFELAAAAGMTAYAVRRGWLNPDEDAVRFLVVLAGLGLTGWLWDADVRTLVTAGNPVDAITLHPGGWLMLVAGMRGVGRGAEVDDRALTRLVLVGVPALAIPWSFGQLATGDLRGVFTDAAFVASLTFVAAGFIAAGLARLQEIGRETGVDWRHDRSWLGTVLGVLVVVLALGIPASILLGLPGDAVARGILDPILAILGYLFVAFAAAAALSAALLAGVLRSFGIQLPLPATLDEIGGLQQVPTYTIQELRGTLTGVAVLWLVLIVIGIVLLRVWLRRRSRPAARGSSDERSFRIPQRAYRLRPPRLTIAAPTPARRPHDAVTAYLAALRDVAAYRPAAIHAEHETPRAHARRVALGTELSALQADYALARYGKRNLTDTEHRRALSRWQRLRDRLRSSTTR